MIKATFERKSGDFEMNIKSKALRVLGVVGGVFFSLLLVASLIITLFYSVAVSITKPETITAVVKELNLSEQLLDNDAVNDILKAEKIDSAVLGDLADSEFFQDVIEKYTNELVDSIQGDEDDFDFDTNTIQKYANRHMDDLIDLVRDYMPKNEKATDEQIENAINRVIGEYGESIVDVLPDGEEVSDMIGGLDADSPLLLLTSTTVPIVLYSLCGVLAVLVFVCLLHKFRGLLCLGIDAVISAALMLIPYLLLAENGIIRSLLEDTEAADMLDPIFSVLADKILIYLVILAVVGILFIAGYIVYVVLTKKQPSAKPIAEPIATPVAPVIAPDGQQFATPVTITQAPSISPETEAVDTHNE
jgi:hypothetical protein